MSKIKQLEDIVDWRLCLGCGACSYICTEDKISLVNIVQEGIRPYRQTTNCSGCNDCIEVCPTSQTDFSILYNKEEPSDFEKDWGRIECIWEGHASDHEIRFKGSSGGALTALSLYCIEKENMYGVLHTGQDTENSILNSTRLSRTREDLMKTTGSRYSPASSCDRLDLVENASSPCVIIGKPAEIAAVRNAVAIRESLSEKIGLTMSFFCAETPSTKATLALLDEVNEQSDRLKSIRYRGHGWPGYFTVRENSGTERSYWIYQKAWAYLQKFRPWATQMWPDGSGELADISCGDPWYEKPDGKNPGFSLIVARTPLGKRIVEGAILEGYLEATIAEKWKLQESQKGLLKKKGSVWGRRLASRVLGIPTTRLKGSNLFKAWRQLTFSDKLKSIIGTFRRILQRGYFRKSKTL